MTKRFSYSTYGDRRAVSPTGRAIGPGRATRTVTARGRQGAPLSIDIACHPKALSPTPRNPGCVKVGAPWGGAYVLHLRRATARGAVRYFVQRIWPTDTGRHTLYVQGVPMFRTDDINDAFGWREAANAFGLKCELFIEG